VDQFVPGYEASGWFGLGAPKATPAEIVDKLNNEINAGLADPKLKARMADWGAHRFRARPLTLASSSPTKSRSGARWFGRPISRQTDAAVPIQYSVTPVLRMVSADELIE
jgi:hypothetical protein